jgi:glycosyltransferase involved in cell wall biosynthesis
MTPLVSIIMPVLNGERYIASAIESICAQTFSDVELLVIDDGSTDRTRDIVHGFSARLNLHYIHHEKNQGITRSINDGLRRSSGKFIAFLDHDDLWLPDFLDYEVSYLLAHPDVGMVHSDFQTIDSEGRILEHSVARERKRTRPSGFIFRDLFMQSMIVGISVLVRRECFDRLGLWDERLRWADYHMWLRIARHYKVDYIPTVLTAYRQHPSQSTRGTTSPLPDELPVAAQVIDRLIQEYPEIRAELGDRTIDRRRASFYFDLAYGSLTAGESRHARACVRRALRLWPTNPQYLGLYAATIFGSSGIEAARSTWRRLRGGAQPASTVRG